MSGEKARTKDVFRNGLEDGLEPLLPLDINACRDFDEMLAGMSRTAFGGRSLGDAAEVMFEMVTDPDCAVVLTLSGAMTVAKLSLVFCELIERNMVHAIVSTGALVAHGLVESAGLHHFKYKKGMDDLALYKKGYDRIYDTLELESNLSRTEGLFAEVAKTIPPGTVLSSRRLTRLIGEHLHNHFKGKGILKSAFEAGVPIFIPAFTDSEMGLDFATTNRRLASQDQKKLSFDPFLDLEEFTEFIRAQEKLGILTLGGGVPRNWAQQAPPYLEQLNLRKLVDGGYKRYSYAVRICPDPAYLGGLSGCSYSEGVSWGKFLPESEGGRMAEVYADATIVWPILVKAVIERMEKGRAKQEASSRNG